MPRLFVEPDDQLGVTTVSSVATNWSVTLRVRNAKGKIQRYSIRAATATTDRVPVSLTPIQAKILEAGEIVGFGGATGSIVAVKRGQFYINAFIQGPSGDVEFTLAKGYVYDGKSLSLSEFVEPGPGGGEGFLSWVSLAADIAPVDLTRVLAATNAIRKIYGFAWDYTASAAAASRTLDAAFRLEGLALPTGHAGAQFTDKWRAVQVVLTADQDGGMFVDELREASNDNSALTIQNTAGAPTPFPYTAVEADLATLFFDVGAADVDDRHSIYLLQEEWLVI